MTKKSRRHNPYLAPVIITIITVLFAACFIALMLLSIQSGAPLSVIILWGGLCLIIYGAIIIGVLIALHQRVREIQGGEEDEARQY